MSDSSEKTSSSHEAEPHLPPDIKKTPKQQKTNWPPSLITLLIAAFIFISSQIIVGIIVAAWAVFTGADIEAIAQRFEDSNTVVAALTVIIGAIQFGLIAWVVHVQGIRFRGIGFRRPRQSDFGSGLLLWGGYFVLSVVSIIVLQANDLGIDIEQEQQLGFSPTSSPAGLAVIYLAIVVTPALIEELLMRGYLFHGLRAKLKFWPTSLIVSSIFAALHLGFWSDEPLLWIAFIDTFLLSLFLCWGTEKYKSIWPAIFAHGIKNSIAFLALFVFA